jgi:hypothetical protein
LNIIESNLVISTSYMSNLNSLRCSFDRPFKMGLYQVLLFNYLKFWKECCTVKTCVNQTSLGPTFVFRIGRCSVYTGWINEDFIHQDFIYLKLEFIQDFDLFRVRFTQVSLYKVFIKKVQIFMKSTFCQYCSTGILEKYCQSWFGLCIVFRLISFPSNC